MLNMGCWYTHVSRITYRTYHVCRAGAEAADSRALLTVIHTYTVRCRYRLSAEHITAVPPPCVHRSLSGREAHHTQLPQKCNPTTAAFENLSETQSSFQRICGGGCIFPTKYPPSADGCCAPATGGRVYLRGLHAARVSSRGRYPRSGNLAAALIGTNVCPSRDHIRRGRGRCHPASFDAGRSVVDVAHMPSTRIRHAIF